MNRVPPAGTVLAAFLVLALAGCGGEKPSAPTPPPAPAPSGPPMAKPESQTYVLSVPGMT